MTTRRSRRETEATEQADQIEDEQGETMTTESNIDSQEYDSFMKWREGQASKKAGGKARRSALQALKKAHESEYNGLVEQFKAQGMD